jgi:chromosome partitioning protein
MIISMAAQKGGVGKTSLALHLSGVAAENGFRVLLCDVDPQHSLSSTLIDDVYSPGNTLKELLLDQICASEVIRRTKFGKIDILPCNLSLGLSEFELLSKIEYRYSLKGKLEKEKKTYDLIIIDCPPSLGIFTLIALATSDYVLIPLECSSYSIRSTMYLIELIRDTKKNTNPKLEILGFVINKIDDRRRIEQDYRDIIRQEFGKKVFRTELKDYVKYAEAATLKIPINFYKPRSEQAEAYRKLFKEIQNRMATAPGNENIKEER